MPSKLPLLFLLPLLACGAEPPPSQGPDAPIGDGEADSDDKRHQNHIVGGRGSGPADGDREERREVAAIDVVRLTPADPKATDDLVARFPLPPGLPIPVTVKYTWTVNGDRVLGQLGDRLAADQGFYRRGDRVQVLATVIDGDGNVYERTSEAVGITNSTPKIVTELRRTPNLDGKELEATDPDGDEITWVIVSGPPGVSITRGGRLNVRVGALQEAWDGELVVGAEDPVGARAELHIPVAVNAAVAGKTETKEVQKAQRAGDLSDNDLEKLSDQEVERTMKMSDKELEAYEKKREAARAGD